MGLRACSPEHLLERKKCKMAKCEIRVPHPPLAAEFPVS